MLLFILITLSFVCASTAKCSEKQRLKLLDCTDVIKDHGGVTIQNKIMGLCSRSQTKSTRLDQRYFSNLQLVDLHENRNINSRLILELKISVRSKCKTKASLTTQQSLLRINNPFLCIHDKLKIYYQL